MNFQLSNILIGIISLYNFLNSNREKKGNHSLEENLMQYIPSILLMSRAAYENEIDEFNSVELYVISAVFKLCSFHEIGRYISVVLLLLIHVGNFYLLSKLKNFMYRMVPQLYSVELPLRSMVERLPIPTYLLPYLYCLSSKMPYLFGILFIQYLRDRLPLDRKILLDVIIVLAISMMIQLLQSVESITRIVIRIHDGSIALIRMPDPEHEDARPAVISGISFLAPLFRSVLKTIGPITSRREDFRNWEKLNPLGRGGFGAVYEGISQITGRRFAVKEIIYRNEDTMANTVREIGIMSRYNHPNIVQYYGAKKSNSKLYIFLELMDAGSLRRVYLNRGPLLYTKVSDYTRQILCGLNFLHQNRVIHRDIKCDNILINTKGDVKLADFGLAAKIRTEDLINARVGTPIFMAPEVYRGEVYDLKADIWSLGSTVLEMSIGDYPSTNPLMDLSRISPSPSTKILKDFIRKCLQPDPRNRPTVAYLLNHPLVNH